jgi:membrane protein
MIAGENGPTSGRRGRLPRAVLHWAGFPLYVLRRFNADGCFAASGALGYTTLVSLVPLAVIALGLLSAFPIFAPVREELLALLFKSFVPSVGEQVAYWFRSFADSATQTTAIGFAGIFATGVLVLVTIEDQLNSIWRVKRPRPWGQRVLAYWTVITMGPLLIGISLTLSTYLEVMARRIGLGRTAILWLQDGWPHWLARGIPAALEFAALTLLYWLIPNCVVRGRDGAVGALFATAAIEVLKIGFVIYIGAMSFYRTVYGALATIPIFLLWMYISWMAVLLGAVVAAALPVWRSDIDPRRDPSAGTRLALSLALVAALARAQRTGTAPSSAILADELGMAPAAVDENLRPLAEGGFAARTREGGWVLSRSPASATLRDLYAILRLPLALGWVRRGSAPWECQVAPAMERIVAAEKAALEVEIATLIGETVEPGHDRRRRSRQAAVADDAGRE